jgi:hypothetical protein
MRVVTLDCARSSVRAARDALLGRHGAENFKFGKFRVRLVNQVILKRMILDKRYYFRNDSRNGTAVLVPRCIKSCSWRRLVCGVVCGYSRKQAIRRR